MELSRPILLTDSIWDQPSGEFRPALALFDVDGTLRGSDGLISDRVREALKALSESGCRVGLATGRSLDSVAPIIASLSVTGPSIIFAGAVVVGPDLSIVRSSPLPAEIVERLVQRARELCVDLELYTISDYFVERESELLATHASYHRSSQKVVDDLISWSRAHQVIKAHLVIRPEPNHDLLDEFRAGFDSLHFGVAHGAGHPDLLFVNVLSAAARSDRTLESILASLEITPNRVLVVGDSDSDLPIISAVKAHRGVSIAMGNAKPHVQSAAGFVTSTVDQDGVAIALERLGLIAKQRS